MKHPTWVAILVALLMAAGGLVATHPSAAGPADGLNGQPSPSAVTALEHSPAPPLPTVLPPIDSLGSAAAEVGSYVGLSTGQIAAIQTWLGGLTPDQLATLRADARSHAAPSAPTLEELGLTPAGLNYYCLGASIAAGTAIGTLGGPFGAIIGFIAGAAVGYYECQQAAVSNNISAAFLSWARAVMGGYGNEANLTAAEFQSIASALNTSTSGWERAADHAALEQLGNSSFNISLDLFQSGIYANLAPVPSAYEYEMTGEFSAIAAAVDGAGGTNDVYGSVGPAVSVYYMAGTFGGVCGSGTSYCVEPPGASSPLTSGAVLPTGRSEYFIPNGSNLTIKCITCSTGLDLYDQITGVWYNLTVDTSACIHYCNVGVFPGPTGMYRIPSQGSSESVIVPGGQPTPTTSSSGWSMTGAILDDRVVPTPTASSAGGTPTQVAIACQGGVSPVCTNPPYDAPATYGYSPTPGPTYAHLEEWITAIEWQSAVNAEAYWSFLRESGFHSAQSIPSDCLVPAPYLVLPSSINSADLNVSEWESLYLATLEGMGHFYNVTLNGTAFCGTQALQQWSWGGSVWGNLYVNATGFVYMTNGTQPVTYNGQPDPTEKLGNQSTWAIGSTYYGDRWYNGSEQLLLMPTISTVSIPIGVRYEVPAGNPIQIYAVQTGLDLWLTGNGTANGSAPSAISAAVDPLGTLAPGDEIYLTSCQVGGTASGNCTLTVQTVNVTLVNITCPGQCHQPQQVGGTFGGLPNPFAWLAGLFAGLFGGGPLGQLLGSLAAGFVILIVILVLVYVVYRVVTGSRRGGDGGGTIVLEGR